MIMYISNRYLEDRPLLSESGITAVAGDVRSGSLISTLSKWSWTHTNDQQQKESVAHTFSVPPYHPKETRAASSLGATNSHFKWDSLCSTVQNFDSFICQSLRGHWWSVSVQHLMDKERRWSHSFQAKKLRGKLTLISKRRASAIDFYRKIRESLGREGSPPVHHSLWFCFGRSVLNPPQLGLYPALRVDSRAWFIILAGIPSLHFVTIKY